MPSFRTKFTGFIKQFGPKADVVTDQTTTPAIQQNSGVCGSVSGNTGGRPRLDYIGGDAMAKQRTFIHNWRGVPMIEGESDPYAGAPAALISTIIDNRGGGSAGYNVEGGTGWSSPPPALESAYTFAIGGLSVAEPSKIEFPVPESNNEAVALLDANLCQYLYKTGEGIGFQTNHLKQVDLTASPTANASLPANQVDQTPLQITKKDTPQIGSSEDLVTTGIEYIDYTADDGEGGKYKHTGPITYPSYLYCWF